MHNLDIQTLDLKNLSLYEQWFDQRAADNLIFRQAEFQDSPARDASAWTGNINGETVAVGLFFTDGSNVGHIDVAVDPSYRRLGYASVLTEYIMGQPVVNDSRLTKVALEQENIGGRKILRKNGFSEVGNTDDGLVEYIKR